MALKTVVETLDGIDDAVKALYAETDGRFILQVEGVDLHPDVANLKNAYERTKADKTTGAAKVAALEAQIAELAKGKPDEAATIAKMKSLEDKIEAITGERDALTGKLTGVTRDRALSDALLGAGIKNPTFLKAAQAMLAGSVKMDGETAIVETPMGPKLLADHVKAWASSEGKDFVTPASGGSAHGNEGGTADKTIKRADFERLKPAEQAARIKSGITPID